MENLQMLAQQVERQRQLRVMEDSVFLQIMDVQDKINRLKAEWNAEESDVEKLKKTGLTTIFYQIIGKKEEKLEKEQQEALAAAARYQTAQAELHGLWRERENLRAERAQLCGCEERLEAAKAARAAELKTDGTEIGEQILELETELGCLKERNRELQEAVSAGTRAMEIVRQVQGELESAENWGVCDLLGGGIVTQMAKHDHLDSAQDLIYQLQNELRCFKTELSDVKIYTDLDLRIDDFLRFADWFFDGLIVDWAVQDKIEQAKENMYRTAWKIQSFLNQLEHAKDEFLRKEQRIKDELDQLLLGT